MGSHLAIRFKNRFKSSKVIALDNLKRRGSELNLARLREHAIEFVHGDVRNKEDLRFDTKINLIVECSAEPSVLAGYRQSPEYLINTNLSGMINCLELARKCQSDFVFLSTSRVYPVSALRNITYETGESRYLLSQGQPYPGINEKGISEEFPLYGFRSLYGATKLASELMLLEYINAFNINGFTNRCSVITGPWQMGKVDQGFVALWVARHFFKKPLSYIGFGGSGKQVRDILHVDDLFNLLIEQLTKIKEISGNVYNVGGGVECSVSLLELTDLCRECTNRSIPIESIEETRYADVPIYLSDCSRLHKDFNWSPQKKPKEIVEEIYHWIKDNETSLMQVLG